MRSQLVIFMKTEHCAAIAMLEFLHIPRNPDRVTGHSAGIRNAYFKPVLNPYSKPTPKPSTFANNPALKLLSAKGQF